MNLYLGTFLIAFTTLALEVTLTRLLSVTTWYHLAFFAISTAMLGMTAGAVTVYLKPLWFSKTKVVRSVAAACVGFAVATPVSLTLLCLVPLVLSRSVMTVLSLLLITVACSLPFYFSGIAISAALTKFERDIGRLYASDLIGASFGCLLVLAGLEKLGAPSLMLLTGAFAALAAVVFCWENRRSTLGTAAGATLVILVALTALNASTRYGITPVVIKGAVIDPGWYSFEEWNSFSRVAVFPPSEAVPQYWGASPVAPRDPVEQSHMTIDGDAATTVRRFTDRRDIEHLRFDITNLAYYLRPQGGACIIGVGGGRDIQAAVLFGHSQVVGIDVNPIFVRLLRDQFKDFAGLAARPGVSLVVDEARSFLSRSTDRFAVIQMSLIDTWAATGAGAFSLSENALYTTEAWKVFLEHLADDGIFTVSRWYNPANVAEAGRTISLAVASLLETGVPAPGEHIAMLTVDRLSTLLVSKRAFSAAEIATLQEIAARLRYRAVVLPRHPSPHEQLARMTSAGSLSELQRAIASEPLNYTPTTDENPYFFNMLRLGHLDAAFGSQEGISAGNLRATIVLLALIASLSIVAATTIILPLWAGSRPRRRAERDGNISWTPAAYFCLIGAGFMLIEIGLIQRLAVFLGHPVYALGVLLFTIIASTGVGSYYSGHLPVTAKRWLYGYPIVTAAAILVTQTGLPHVVAATITEPPIVKSLLSIAVIFPLGVLLGVFFPLGMRLVDRQIDPGTPWYWALNGVFGVLSSALAVFISIYFGISKNFYIATACYAVLVVCLPAMARDRAAVVASRLAPNVGQCGRR